LKVKNDDFVQEVLARVLLPKLVISNLNMDFVRKNGFLEAEDPRQPVSSQL